MKQELNINQRNLKNETKALKGKNLKKQVLEFAFLLLCFIAIFFNNNNVANATVIEPTSEFYVNDSANILSSDTENYIISTNIELHKKTGAQIVVVTVKSLDGISIEQYANELFNSWGIGDKTKNNGLLLLCSYGDREFRVEVGYGLEGKLPDGKTGRMQDEYIIPYLKENNFDEGIKNGYSAFLQEVASEYNVEITGSEQAIVSENDSEESILDVIFPIILYMLVWRIYNICKIKKWKRRTIYFLRRWWWISRRLWRIFWRRFLRWRRPFWWRRK